MVDEETRLDNSISLPGNVFQYNYTLINIERENIVISEIEDYIRPLILNNIKTNPDLKAFRDNEVTMAYDYKDKFGVYLFKLAFTSDQYT